MVPCRWTKHWVLMVVACFCCRIHSTQGQPFSTPFQPYENKIIAPPYTASVAFAKDAVDAPFLFPKQVSTTTPNGTPVVLGMSGTSMGALMLQAPVGRSRAIGWFEFDSMPLDGSTIPIQLFIGERTASVNNTNAEMIPVFAIRGAGIEVATLTDTELSPAGQYVLPETQFPNSTIVDAVWVGGNGHVWTVAATTDAPPPVTTGPRPTTHETPNSTTAAPLPPVHEREVVHVNATLLVRVQHVSGMEQLVAWSAKERNSWHTVLGPNNPEIGTMWCDHGVLEVPVRACFNVTVDDATNHTVIQVMDAHQGQVVATLGFPADFISDTGVELDTPSRLYGAPTWCDSLPIWTQHTVGKLVYPADGDPANATFSWLWWNNAEYYDASVTSAQPLCEPVPTNYATVGFVVNTNARCVGSTSSGSAASFVISSEEFGLIYSTLQPLFDSVPVFSAAMWGTEGLVMKQAGCSEQDQFLTMVAWPASRDPATGQIHVEEGLELNGWGSHELQLFRGLQSPTSLTPGFVARSQSFVGVPSYLFDFSGNQVAKLFSCFTASTAFVGGEAYAIVPFDSRWRMTSLGTPPPDTVTLPSTTLHVEYDTESGIEYTLTQPSTSQYNVTVLIVGQERKHLGELGPGFQFNFTVPTVTFRQRTNRLVVTGSSSQQLKGSSMQMRWFIGIVDTKEASIVAQITPPTKWSNPKTAGRIPFFSVTPDGLYVLVIGGTSSAVALSTYSAVNGSLLKSQLVEGPFFTACVFGMQVFDVDGTRLLIGCFAATAVIDVLSLGLSFPNLAPGSLTFGSALFTHNGTRVTVCAGGNLRHSNIHSVDGGGNVRLRTLFPTSCNSNIVRSDRGYVYTMTKSLTSTGLDLIRFREFDLGDAAAVPTTIPSNPMTLRLSDSQQLLVVETTDGGALCGTLDLISGELLWTRQSLQLLPQAPQTLDAASEAKNNVWAVDVTFGAVVGLNVFTGDSTFVSSPFWTSTHGPNFGAAVFLTPDHHLLVQLWGWGNVYDGLWCLWYDDPVYFTDALPPVGFRKSTLPNFPSSRFPLPSLPPLPPLPPPPNRHTQLIVGGLLGFIALCAAIYFALTTTARYRAQRQVVREEARLLAEPTIAFGVDGRVLDVPQSPRSEAADVVYDPPTDVALPHREE